MTLEQVKAYTGFNSFFNLYRHVSEILNPDHTIIHFDHPEDRTASALKLTVTVQELKAAAFDEIFPKLPTIEMARDLMHIASMWSTSSEKVQRYTDFIKNLPIR